MARPKQIPPLVSLRTLRNMRGWSSGTLAKKIGEHGVTVDPDSILAIELGHRGTTNALRVAWAKALDLNFRDIFLDAEVREIVAGVDEARAA